MLNDIDKNSLNVRSGDICDVDEIVNFNINMALETEGIILEEATLARGVAAVFSDSTLGFYMIAELESTVIGQLMITKEWSDWRNSMFWWIQSVFVRPEYRRIGVYTALYAKVLEMAKNEAHVCGVRLYVDRDNTAAKQTYSELGMSHSNYDMYEVHL